MMKGMQEKSFAAHWIYIWKIFAFLLLTRMQTTFYLYIGTQDGTCKISRENFHGLLEICKNHY